MTRTLGIVLTYSTLLATSGWSLGAPAAVPEPGAGATLSVARLPRASIRLAWQDGLITPGYLDRSSKTFYRFRNVSYSKDQVDLGSFRRIVPLTLGNRGIRAIDIDLPVAFVTSDKDAFHVGYHCASHSVLYRWVNAAITKEQAKKDFPTPARNVLDVKRHKLLVREIDVPGHVRARFGADNGKRRKPNKTWSFGGRPLRLGFAEHNAGIVPGYNDSETKTFFRFTNVTLPPPRKGAPNSPAAPAAKDAIIKPKEAGVSMLEIALPVMFLKAGIGGYDVGYFCASHGIFYRWRDLRIAKQQASKRFPSYAKNALSVQEQKLAVLDIKVARELKARYEPKRGPVGATTKNE